MRKISVSLGLLALVLVLAYGLLVTCGQQTAEEAATTTTAAATTTTAAATTTTATAATTTTTAASGTTTTTTSTTSTTSGSMIQGTVLVPAASLNLGGAQAAAVKSAWAVAYGVKAAATDGVSDTPLPNATVTIVDFDNTAILSTTTNTNGAFSTTYDGTLPDSYIVRATYSSGGNTTVVESVRTPDERTDITLNAGETVRSAKIRDELKKRCGNLPDVASSKGNTESANIRSAMYAIREKLAAIPELATLSSGNLPTITYAGTNTADVIDNLIYTVGDYADSRISSSSNSTAVSNYTSYLSGDFNTYARAIVNTLVIPAGTSDNPIVFEGWEDFTLPSGFDLPSAYVRFDLPYENFPASDFPSDFYDYVVSDMANTSGLMFDTPVYDNLAGYLPSGVYFMSDAALQGSGWYTSGACPAGTRWGISPPSGVYMPSGSTLDDNAVLLTGVKFSSGFLLTDDMEDNIGSGTTITSDWFGYMHSDFDLRSDLADNLASDIAITSGMFNYFGSGFALGSDYADNLHSDIAITNDMFNYFGSGFVLGSDYDDNLASNFVFGGDTNTYLGSDFIMPSDANWGSDYVPPSGMQYESGFQQPSGWTPPSGFQQPSGWQGGPPLTQ